MRSITDSLADLTTQLVAFQSVDGATPDALHACVDFVREHVHTHLRDQVPGVREWPLPEAGGKPTLLLTRGDQPPRVLLSAHVDVVAATDEAAFQTRRAGKWLTGRGTADMKGPLAALIDIFETLPLPGLGLLITSDEENGGQHGTAHVLERIPWRPEVVLLPDGGANMRLITEQKGVLRLRLAVGGRSTHAARPWKGKNAAELLYAAHRVLRRAYRQPTHEDDWRLSLALTQVRTGDNALNVVPDYAEGVLDIRYPGSGPSAWQPDALLADIRARLASARTFRAPVTVTELLRIDPFLLDLASPWIARLQAIAQNIRGAPLPLAKEAGASDARFYGRRGIPVLMFQPRCADWHGSHERIHLESLAQFHAICADLVRAALAEPA